MRAGHRCGVAGLPLCSNGDHPLATKTDEGVVKPISAGLR
ncbi:hypothetical protein I547_3914 [Mycobacterium kansasii 824]|uniref:Uncharacterized protein n=1 Tax=Mycobacterium kansasii TaxID=1768 RepID=A0A1V3XM99_MYCKA|nr:hypothetical protein I547_3914 [Mycobacterium kansasii 824]OOK78375.1 hypothetical protein BZL30_2210 [Mycobacterium kansasii]OOK79906.1 hypothetical protein BZL29_2200 [Mycobacterium kansasii]